MDESNKKSKFGLLIIIILALTVVIVSSSYAYYRFSAKGESENKIKSCSLNLDVNDVNGIGLVSTYPIDDSEADNFDPFTLTITNNSSRCNDIYYYINANNYCNICTPDASGNCTVNDTLVNCNDGHSINPEYIRYKVTNLITGEEVVGSNPEYMYIPGHFVSSGTNNYDIRMWISNNANNEDIYEYNNGEIVYNGDVPVSKSYAAKFETNISTKEVEHNVAILNEDLFNSFDYYYGNKYSVVNYYSINYNYNIFKNVWKDNTRYKITYEIKAPAATLNLMINFFYTDGTSSYGSVVSNGEWKSSTYYTLANKTIKRVGFIYNTTSGATSANTFFIKNVKITEYNG